MGEDEANGRGDELWEALRAQLADDDPPPASVIADAYRSLQRHPPLEGEADPEQASPRNGGHTDHSDHTDRS